jgi:glycosyltransferase involved in cell wall biosynthesis
MSTDPVARSVSVIIPTFNGEKRIANCIDALLPQLTPDIEVLVVNDGSTDNTASVVSQYPAVRLVNQSNAGPAAARNHGAYLAHGEFILFLDDDCVPLPGWIKAMVEPFSDPEIMGTKGIYCTKQESLIARFVQLDYEDRYKRMARFPHIDFIDTYAAGFRRDRFVEMNGFDTAFPVACAEDADLSYRMSMLGWKMKFVPSAIVSHTHPDRLSSFVKKKYKFAFWRMMAIRKNPKKGVRDSHTPQLLKLQVLLLPMLALAALFDLTVQPAVPASSVVLGLFVLSTVPFTTTALSKDPLVGLLAPYFLALRSGAQCCGVALGVVYASRHQATVGAKAAT